MWFCTLIILILLATLTKVRTIPFQALKATWMNGSPGNTRLYGFDIVIQWLLHVYMYNQSST